MTSRTPHRYRANADRPATGPTLRRRGAGTPTALAVAALRELNPAGPARAALLEALDADTPGTLDQLLRTHRLEPALRQLLTRARDSLRR